MNAIATSKAEMATVKANGSHPSNNGKDSAMPKRTAKIVWPAVMFANNLTASANGRANWLITSIGIINGSRSGGVPGGIKICKNFTP